MVEGRLTDGRRIGELLASELDGRSDGRFEQLAVENADQDVEPTVEGARAYDVVRSIPGGGESRSTEGGGADAVEARIARAFVHPDRVRLEIERAPDRAASVAEETGLRVRPKTTEPPRTLVFVEDGRQVKRATDVIRSVLEDEKE